MEGTDCSKNYVLLFNKPFWFVAYKTTIISP